MPGTCCAVPGCSKRGGHEFPVNGNQSTLWVIAIRRLASKATGSRHDKLWKPSQSSVVCKDHFTPQDYKDKCAKGHRMVRKELKSTAVPSVFPWTPESSATVDDRNHRALIRGERSEQNAIIPTDVHADLGDSLIVEDMQLGNIEEVTSATQSAENACTEPAFVNTVDKAIQTQIIPPSRTHVHEEFKNDQRGIQYYTGLDTYEVFLDVFCSLGPAVRCLNYMYGVPGIVPKDQLLLTLIKLRTYKTNYELSRMFKITELDVYSTFVSWVRFMALQWREIDIWPDRDTVRYYAPSDFRRQFPTTRVVFDGTECPIQKPKAPATQQITFSTYKNKNTAKVLIGVTPGGMVSYVSPAYGGSASDRQIVERSNITNIVDPKDSLMADKGFDVQDLFAPIDVTINIPTFFKKKNRMSGKTVLKDRAISSKRVHVERVIGLGKTYKILTHSLNNTEATLASDIIFICYMLVNFRRCIVPPHA